MCLGKEKALFTPDLTAPASRDALSVGHSASSGLHPMEDTRGFDLHSIQRPKTNPVSRFHHNIVVRQLDAVVQSLHPDALGLGQTRGG